jgi:hypothetical protein
VSQDQRPLSVDERVALLAQAWRIGQSLDNAEALAHQLDGGRKAKAALLIARYWVNRSRPSWTK